MQVQSSKILYSDDHSKKYKKINMLRLSGYALNEKKKLFFLKQSHGNPNVYSWEDQLRLKNLNVYVILYMYLNRNCIHCHIAWFLTEDFK
jgi:hypothetical protein